MIFYSKEKYENEIIWDKEENKILCKFEDGKCNVRDNRVKEILKSLGYKNDGTEEEEIIEVKKAKKGKKDN
jgi:hypothetical protein